MIRLTKPQNHLFHSHGRANHVSVWCLSLSPMCHPAVKAYLSTIYSAPSSPRPNSWRQSAKWRFGNIRYPQESPNADKWSACQSQIVSTSSTLITVNRAKMVTGSVYLEEPRKICIYNEIWKKKLMSCHILRHFSIKMKMHRILLHTLFFSG